ncbi:MAG: aldehyde ferredoxin oxidoreductase N-terminal domain-containing protein [Desulfatiglans sp.]|jgi:aldehyde:ferredoxin oxidoreductase|nr:aldehyde ferredoxin oxidoreductase N-terminal domain-containing protein [Thermodesulfobacteriota bacterium]MEE4351974.1 aldehyde ferredoxin oxidoreductase N-terminal domain-containing protein [Desulfatiglans sp.]
MEYYGYAGRVLYVDLSSGKVNVEPLDMDMAKEFLGGFGVNNRLAYDNIEPGEDTLSPKNPVILGAGPLVGTMAPGAVRIMGATKFPLTGAVAWGAGSMSFGTQLKWAGYDHVVITGRAESPVYISILDDQVEICDARHLWGKTIHESADELWKHHEKSGIIGIGQGGENMVKYALTLVDRMATLGRGGFGAVMGSKNLKSIVVRGTRGIRIADRKRFMKIVDDMYQRCKRYPLHQAIVDYGIMSNWNNYVKQLFYYKNYSEIYPADKATERYGPHLYEKIQKRAVACPSCFIADKEIIKLTEGEYEGLVQYTSSFVNIAMIGTRFEINDYTQAAKLIHLLDEYGICMMTFCGLADFLISLYEQGIIDQEDTGGWELKRDFNTILTMIQKVNKREGFGGVIADGWIETIEKIGKGCGEDAPIIKGQDIVWEPRITGLGTNDFEQVVCPRGPQAGSGGSPTYIPNMPPEQFHRHLDRMGVFPDAKERILSGPFGVDIGRLTRYSEDWASVFNSLGICNRHVNNRFYHVDIISELYSSATGIEISSKEMMDNADRVWNMLRILNAREGFSRKDDIFPEIWFKPMKDAEGNVLKIMDYYHQKVLTRDDLKMVLDHYYDERGWDKETGNPSRQKLNELGLSFVAEDFATAGLL